MARGAACRTTHGPRGGTNAVVALLLALAAATVSGTPLSESVRCHVCGLDSALSAALPGQPVQECSPELLSSTECPASYKGCLTTFNGRTLTRTCEVRALQDPCRLANGVIYCYCSGSLCNAQAEPVMRQLRSRMLAASCGRDGDGDDEDCGLDAGSGDGQGREEDEPSILAEADQDPVSTATSSSTASSSPSSTARSTSSTSSSATERSTTTDDFYLGGGGPPEQDNVGTSTAAVTEPSSQKGEADAKGAARGLRGGAAWPLGLAACCVAIGLLRGVGVGG